MPSNCCVANCANTSAKGYSLYHFPKDEERKKQWLSKICSKPMWVPKAHHVVCEAHFEPSVVNFVGGRKELESGAIPVYICTCNKDKPKPCAALVDHQYTKPTSPKRTPLGVLQPNITAQPSRKREQSCKEDEENRPIPSRRKRVHSIECPMCRPPLKEPPPNPQPLPSKPSQKEVEDLIQENIRLKKQVSSLQERAKLVSKIVSTDQLVALKLGDHRGVKWSTKSLIEGLSLRFSCGAAGYEQLRKKIPLPGSRTLRRAVQHIDNEPGVLDVVFDCLQQEVPKMRVLDQDCVIVFDEMSIDPRLDLDRSTNCYIGNVTIPHGQSSDCACKAMVFMVNGLAKRFKQVVGYHFCGSKNNTNGAAIVLREILERCERVGLNVIGIVCDMGNRGIMKLLGFRFECERMVYKVPNPANPTKTLYVIPDTVHVFKSVKEMLSKSKQICLPDDIVARYKLPSNVVKVDQVQWLEEEQHHSVLKFAPRLKGSDIKASHFKKMKVSCSTNVLSPQVGGALIHLGKKREDPSMVTTGWFVKMIRRWFTIVTSRHQGTALSHRNTDSYDDAIEVMNLICAIFERANFDSGWRVTQTHIIMACRALLEIQQVLLSKGYSYVCLGNLTQDSIENVFSCMRIMRPKPSALDFKFRLKQYVLGRVAVKVENASYNYCDAPTLISLLTTERMKSPQAASPPTESTLVFQGLDSCPDIRDDEKDFLYRMSGCVLHRMRKKFKCAQCWEKLLHKEPLPHPHAGLVIETDIKSQAQVRVSNSLFQMYLAAERLLVASIHLLPKMRPWDKAALTKHIHSELQRYELPTCHEVRSVLIGRYLSMRFAQLSRYLTQLVTPVSTAFGSRSMGMRVLADNFNGSAART